MRDRVRLGGTPRRLAAAAAALLVTATGLVADTNSVAVPPPPPASAGSAVALAARTGQPVEVTGLTSPTEQVLANPDGTFTARLNASPVRVRRADGWAPVDTTLRRQPDGTVRPGATTADIAFSGGGADAMARLRTDGRDVALRWPGGLPRPALAADTATYRDVLPDVDLVLRAATSGFSMVLVVRTAAAAAAPALRRLAFGLETPDLTVARDEAGALTVTDAAGSPVATTGTAWMWDSTGGRDGDRLRGPAPGDRIRPVTTELGPAMLTLVPDARMLADPALTFPLYIDPPFYAAGAAKRQHWLMISEGHPDYGWWDTTWWGRVGTRTDGYSTRRFFRSYFQLDTSRFVGKHIHRATFRTWLHSSESCTPRPIQLWQTGPITSKTTWKTAPKFDRQIASREVAKGGGPSCPSGFMEVLVTDWLSGITAAGTASATVALRVPEVAAADEGGTELAGLDSDPQKNPVIVVDYNSPPDQPSGLRTADAKRCDLVTRSATSELGARVSDADGEFGQLVAAEFEIAVRGGGRVGTLLRSSPQGPGSEFRILAPALADGAYSWRVRGDDEITTGPWSPWCDITVDTVAPSRRPTVTSPFDDGWTPYEPATLVFRADGDDDVVAFRYVINGGSPVDVPADTPGGMTAVEFAPPAEPWQHTVTVRSVDRAGNASPATTVSFEIDAFWSWINGPVAQWPFDDGSGPSALDVTYNGNDALLLPGASWTPTGQLGGALRFDGAAGHAATTGPVANLDGPLHTDASLAVAGWVRLDSLATSATAVALDGAANSAVELGYDAAAAGWTFAMRAQDDPAAGRHAATARVLPQLGVWTHLTGVYDHEQGRLSLYVNGRPAASAAHNSSWDAHGPLSLSLGRGRLGGSGVRPWTGAVDELRVYRRVLSGWEVRDLSGHLSGLTGASWALNEGSGVTSVDGSGNGHTLAVRPGVSWAADRRGASGRALHFDGGTGFAYTANPVLQTDTAFTIAGWARLAELSRDATAVSQDDIDSSAFQLGYSTAAAGWVFDAGGGTARSVLLPAPGVWTHLAGVYDPDRGQLRLYVNGRLAATAATATAIRGEGAMVLGRGQRAGGWERYWRGDLDDVQALSWAVDDAGIPDLTVDPPSGVGGSWTFEEGSGFQAADRSGNRHSLSLAGAASWAGGVAGTALSLDGATGHAYSAGPVARTDRSFTVAVWVRLDRSGVAQTVLSQAGQRGSAFTLRYQPDSGRWTFGLTDRDSDNPTLALAVSDTTAQAGTWTHLAGVFDAQAARIRLYVNGALDDEAAVAGSWQADGALQVGRARQSGGYGGYLSGRVDDLHVLDHAADTWEISGLSGLPPTPAAGPYRIRALHSNMCLAERETATTGYVHQAKCSESKTTFVLEALGEGRFKLLTVHPEYPEVTGCLGVENAAASVGGRVRNGYCSSRGQVVRLVAVNTPARGFRILTEHAGLCLAVASATTGAWADVTQATCGSAGQAFIFDDPYSDPDNPSAPPIINMVAATLRAEPPPLPAAGPVRIRATHSGRCLGELPGAGSGQVYQTTCLTRLPAMSLDQTGVDTYRIRTDHPDFGPGCMGVSGSSSQAGATVLDDICPAGGQRFRLVPVDLPVPGFRIRAEHSGLCLGVTADSTLGWTALRQATCDPNAAGQVFAFDDPATPADPVNPLPVVAGPVRVRATHSGLCLGERPGSGSGAVLQVACANRIPAMKLEEVGDDTYRITVNHPQFGPGCMGVAGGGRTDVGAPIADDACEARLDQVFRLERAPSGSGYRIHPVHTDLCLTVVGGATQEWTAVQQLTCDVGAVGQIFTFDP